MIFKTLILVNLYICDRQAFNLKTILTIYGPFFQKALEEELMRKRAAAEVGSDAARRYTDDQVLPSL